MYGRPPHCQAVMRHSDFPEFTLYEGENWSYLTHEQPQPGGRRAG